MSWVNNNKKIQNHFDTDTKQEVLEFDAVSGLRVNKHEMTKMVKISVGLGEMEVNAQPTAVINGIKFVFPDNAKWICFEKNGVVYWSEKQLKMSHDEYTREPLGWGAAKTPIFTINEDGFQRALIRKDINEDDWKISWQRLARVDVRAKSLMV